MYSIYAMTVMEDFTISDFAQAFVLGLGAISALLLVIWQSRCLCRCRIGISDQCYIFDCQRSPPPLKEDKKEEELAEEQEQEQEENPEDPPIPVNP